VVNFLKKFMVLTFVSLSACADDGEMVTTTYGTIPSHVIKDSRRTVNMVQSALRESTPAVVMALKAAEDAGFTGGSPNYNDASFSSIEEGSFIGFGAPSNGAAFISVYNPDGGKSIIVPFSASELGAAGIGEWLLLYTPVTQGDDITGWTCKSTAATDTHLGKIFIKPQDGAIDPILQGLGWPYVACKAWVQS
jgi:hypothetical protein